MRTRILIETAAVGALLVAGPAGAADLRAGAGAGASSGSVPLAYWSGAFVGAHGGWTTGHAEGMAREAAGTVVPVRVDLFEPYDLAKGTGSYSLGLHAGYNWALPSRWVVGVEADITTPNTIGTARTVVSPGGDQTAFGEAVTLAGTLRGRVGYAFDSWLAYATAGFAWSFDRMTATPNPGAATGDEQADGTVAARLWRFGWAAGGGLEIPLTPAWSARAEYLYTGFGTDGVTLPGGRALSADLSAHTIRLGLDYRLGEGRSPFDPLATGVSGLETDRFAFHGQTTYTHQYASPFRSPYAGQNSFYPNQARQTFDATFYIGMRLWDGAELWVNPEIDQGFGLSRSFGVAGFPSGEAYKAGADYPYARLPRAFLRQTIDLGGETETVEGGINQFSGKQTSDRLVITVGKFSVGDVFDTNKYAHDPRTDFLNWALADTGTFDYAADAWAFTYGATVEWYRGDWTFRAGAFDLPKVPNSTDLDPTFQQFELVGEVERRHEIAGRKGKVAVTGFLNRARLATFDDAIAYGQLTGTTPDLAAVRRYRSKTGLSVNVEQEITPTVGAFLRAGFNSGNVETNAFTDISRALAGGLVLSGRMWSRPDDTIGIAGIVNQISPSHVAYLNAGGLTAILGDGMLPNPGREKIVETYYAFPLGFGTWRMTLDYQFVSNPGYNRDRGPASVFGTRLRSTF
ncbi:carbohydrate porin [Rhodoplanes azumiensis]|uniref:Carbohydrate porin n=1 Tax=Rhodoplanes azumiensis TaxID=1897628 RepID=A0ABW5AL08_9BRAD